MLLTAAIRKMLSLVNIYEHSTKYRLLFANTVWGLDTIFFFIGQLCLLEFKTSPKTKPVSKTC